MGYEKVSESVKEAIKKKQTIREVIILNDFMPKKELDEIIGVIE